MAPTSTTPVIPADNIFVPIQTDNILPQIPIGQQHPVPRKGIEDNEYRTLHTNKFYANAFLGEQNQPVWTHPYVLWWGKGGKELGAFASWGMNVGHSEEDDLVYGEGVPAKNFGNARRQSIILGAGELDGKTLLTTDTHLPFSVNINLKRGTEDDAPKISFPVVQGMGFVTARYTNASPMVQTAGQGFKDVSSPVSIGKSVKYRIKDMDDRSWILYVHPGVGTLYDAKHATRITKLDAHTIILPSGFTGTLQLARNSLGAEGEALYDRSFNTFVTAATITASVAEARGTYSFLYSKIGSSPLLMFLLPHHLQSLDPELKPGLTKLQLRTTTKGTATAIFVTDHLTFVEPNLPTTMGFGPWTPAIANTRIRYPPDMLAFLAGVAERDLRRSMTEEKNQDSTYQAGKSLAKFATIIWVIKDVLSNTPLASTALDKLKLKMARYVQNRQHHPLYYDDAWKGVVSNAGFSNGPAADFANTYYNDHHAHYGYFVYAAAVIAYLDPGWLERGDNRAWTNMLVKDFAESEYAGRDYPFSRSFDWWHGHSWARGLFEAPEGKEQEAMGEDGFAAFAVKMWGRVCGDGNMERRGTLMLAVQARSFSNYFCLASSNASLPPRFLDSKVPGVLSENRVDYATSSTAQPHVIHSKHMSPISPASTYLRPRHWVREEWDHHFSNGRALVDGGGRGILHANLAIVDAKASYAFFRDGVEGLWDERWIDEGGSRTWYLVWSAGLGGGR